MMRMYARFIVDIKVKRKSSTVELFQTLWWTPVDVYKIQMYNIVYGNAPSYHNEMFKINTQLHACVQYQK